MRRVVGALAAAVLVTWGAQRAWIERGASARAAEPPASVDSTAPEISSAPTPAAPRPRDSIHAPATPEQGRAELERTGRVLAESIPWLEERKLGAERAGREGEARTLSLRVERLVARRKLVEEGIDPDAPGDVGKARGSSQ